MLSIHHFADLCHCTTQTLRYYDQRKLLNPFYKEPSTGYRYYKEIQVFEYYKIKELQKIGFSIKEIKNIKDQSDDTLLNMIDQKIQTHEDLLHKSIQLKETYLKKKMELEKDLKEYANEHKIQINQIKNTMNLCFGSEELDLQFECDPTDIVNLFISINRQVVVPLDNLADFSDIKNQIWKCSKVYSDWNSQVDLINIIPSINSKEKRMVVHLLNITSDITLFDVSEIIESMKELGYDGEDIFFTIGLSDDNRNHYAVIYTSQI